MFPASSNTLIATILRHDRKVTSYKIALIRALNDVVLSFPDVTSQNYTVNGERDVAVPLRMLAEFWLAYYWPFADAASPVLQGQTSQRDGVSRSDISFRHALEQLRSEWERAIGAGALASDGFFLRSEFLTSRRRSSYSQSFQAAYGAAVAACIDALQQPIRYAGGGENTVFAKPCRLHQMAGDVVALPGAIPQDVCLRVSAELWASFRELSLWIEALCIHEWAIFTESIGRNQSGAINRGAAYMLLTAHPDNRRPLTWERNCIEILLMEGALFQCPWTKKTLSSVDFDIDHLLPLTIYPINEMWNLVPADRHFNQRTKRDRIPSLKRLLDAQPLVARAYANYERTTDLQTAIHEDASIRFAGIKTGEMFSTELSARAIRFIDEVAGARGAMRF